MIFADPQFFDVWARTTVVPDRRPTYEWAGGSRPDKSDAAVDFGRTTAFQGVYDVANVPWTRAFLDACDSPTVREVTFVAPPQESGKTKAAETYLARRICTAPTNLAFNTTTNVKAEAWSETRWEAMLTSTRGVKEKFSANKHLKKKRRIVFKDGTFLLIQGAEVPGNRSSDSVEVQVNDEVEMWDRPWLHQMHGRCLAYPDTCKRINVSVAGVKKGELHERFLAGNQLEWCHHCPACRKPFAYVFDAKDARCNIRFDVNKAVLHADGRLDLREFEKTVFVNCPDAACGWRTAYDRELLAELNRGGAYVARNPDADPDVISLHVNAFAIGRRKWSAILEPWVKLHIRGGVFSPEVLREFITRELAEFWDEKPFVVTTEVKLGNFKRADVIRPKLWRDEEFRGLFCDNQHGRKGDVPHRMFAGVLFTRDGRLRVADAGRVDEWDGLRKKQVEFGVPDPTEAAPGPWTVVDRRHEPQEVDEWCAKFRWYGAMGAAAADFLHPNYSQFAGTRQLFTEPRLIDIGFGTAEGGRTFATYFLWSSQKIQGKLAQLRNEGKLELPSDLIEFFPDAGTQLNSHKQFMETNRDGTERPVWKRIGDTPDHLWDMLCEAVVIGYMAGIYRDPIPNENLPAQ